MRILADENIPYLQTAFAGAGELRLAAGRHIGREINRAQLREVDALLVRSVTRVDEALLAGSKVRFVGSATAGVDHIDESYLKAEGIAFAHAPGSNAPSVRDWVIAALFHLRGADGRKLEGGSIGIVGAGQVGSRVARTALALGMTTVLCDPPLARTAGDAAYRPLEEALACDFLTLHVPLNLEGPDRTAGLIDRSALARMKPGIALLNSSRGGVIDEDALLEARSGGKISALAIDVWAGEPKIRPELARVCDIATPHIAGYAIDAKAAGTEMILRAFCEHFRVQSTWSAKRELAEVRDTIEVEVGDLSFEDAMAPAIEKAYSISRDDAALRGLLLRSEGERAAGFDALRKNYPERREFKATRLVFRKGEEAYAERARDIGFLAECP